MQHVPFGQIRTVEGLAANLGCGVSDLEQFSTGNQRGFYIRRQIPKKGKRQGSFRTVYQPIPRLALIQKNLAQWITSLTTFDSCVQGFVRKRSIGSNARLHLGARLLLHVDIRDFFDTIGINAVEQAFRVLGFAPPLAMLLSGVCTLKGRLPQGANSSPVLANLVCGGLDVDLKRLSQTSGCTYSRYADDITISGETLPEVTTVATIVSKYGFQLRDDKCRLQRRGRSQYVTGLTVSDLTGPRVPRVQKRRLRLEMHYATRFGLVDHLERTCSPLAPPEAIARLRGWINFLYSIEGSGRLFEQWTKLLAREQDFIEAEQHGSSPATS